MKRAFLALTVICIILFPAAIVYAGSVNSYESEIIAAAQRTYEYNGIQYKLAPSYLDRMREYFLSDEVDLTAEQRDEILAQAYSSVADGVAEGYLLPVQDSESKTTEETDKTTGDTKDSTKGSTKVSEAPKDTSKEHLNSEFFTSVTEILSSGSTDTAAADQTAENTKLDEKATKEQQSELKGTTENSKVNTSGETQTIQPSGENAPKGDSVGQNDTIIKNTGFCLNNAIIVVVGMVMLMIFGIYVTLRSDFFAHSDE